MVNQVNFHILRASGRLEQYLKNLEQSIALGIEKTGKKIVLHPRESAASLVIKPASKIVTDI